MNLGQSQLSLRLDTNGAIVSRMPELEKQRRTGESIAVPINFATGKPNRAEGDVFDDFLMQTGGDPAPRGGHEDAIAGHIAKISDFGKEPRPGYGPGPTPESHAFLPEGILPAVQPDPNAIGLDAGNS